MSQKLLYHPPPRVGEGLNGFLLYLAEGNCLSGVRDLFGRKAPTQEVLHQYLGKTKDPNYVNQLFIQRSSDNESSLPLWNHRTSRYCPECLNKNGFWLQEWELSLFTACPIHRCRLVGHCVECGETLDWSRGALLRCDCGSFLGDATTAPAHEFELAFAEVLFEKLKNKETKIRHLQVLDLRQLHRLSVVLGAYANRRDGVRPLKIDGFAALNIVRPLVISAANILIDWPAGLNEFLDGLKDCRANTADASQLLERFGYFYNHLTKDFRDPAFGFLLGAFETYLEKNWRGPIGARHRTFSQDFRKRHAWIPAKSAAQTLGTSRRQLMLFVESGKIDSTALKTSDARTVLCINQQEFPLIRSLLADLVDQQTACAMLGIGKARVAQLILHSVLGPAIAPKSARTSRWTLSRSFLGNLLTLGDNLPLAPDDGIDATKVSLGYALRYWLHRDYLFPRLVVEIIDGKIAPVAISSKRKGLSAWMFDTVELRNWTARQIKGKRDGALTIPDAALNLRMKQEVVYHLVTIGLISYIVEPDSGHHLIETSALDEFRRKFVLGSELSKCAGTVASHLAKCLKKEHIEPVSDPAVDGSRQNVYLRDNWLDLAMKRIVHEREERAKQVQVKEGN